MFGQSLILGGLSCTTDVNNYQGNNVAYYKLDGNADDEKNSHDATAYNVTYGVGQYGNSAVFNGSSSYLSVAHDNDFNWTGSKTISLWVRFNSLGSGSVGIAAKSSNTSNYGWFLYKNGADNKIAFSQYDSSDNAASVVSDNAAQVNTWYHVCVTGDGTTNKLYINGVEEDSASAVTATSTTDALVFGRFYSNISNYYLNGVIDQVRFFDTTLSSSKVEKLYNESACPFDAYDIEYLVVAGGASGGGWGGGGGAGGFRTSTISQMPSGVQMTITVGAGGTAPITGANYHQGNSGSNSSISAGGFNTIASTGGGGGGYYNGNAGLSGGSGGGGGIGSSNGQTVSGGTGNAGSYTPSEGNSGGTGGGYKGSQPYDGGGGGGGASQAGSNGQTSGYYYGGDGGDGTQSSITGTATYYAGGGGGHTDGRVVNAPSTSSGGQGGGGNGGRYGGTSGVANAQNGTANLGGGGGSAYGSSSLGLIGSGGSGVVILKVPTASYSGTTTGSPTITTSGSFTIIKFTGSGTYTS